MGIFAKLKGKFKKQDAETQLDEEMPEQDTEEPAFPMQEDEIEPAKTDSIDQIRQLISELDGRISNIENNFSQKGKSESMILPEANLSAQEKEIVEYIENNSGGDANSIADALGMSRSNASLKLNKLFSWNILDKKVDNRKVVFCLKQKL